MYIINSYRLKQPAPSGGAMKFTIKTLTDNVNFTVPATDPTTAITSLVWGDGDIDTNVGASPNHTYLTAGTYQVEISGFMPLFSFNNTGDASLMRTFDEGGDVGLTSVSSMFYGCYYMTSANVGMLINPSITTMYQMFRGCTRIKTIDLSGGDYSGVASITFAFRDVRALEVLDMTPMIPTLDLNYMTGTFQNTFLLSDIIALEDLDTSGLLGNYADLFQGGGLGPDSYSKVLNINTGWPHWLANTTGSGNMNFGYSTYYLADADAVAGRAFLESKGWTILDGGGI